MINPALLITFANDFIDKFAADVQLCADDEEAIGLLLLPLLDQSSIATNILEPGSLISGAWLMIVPRA